MVIYLGIQTKLAKLAFFLICFVFIAQFSVILKMLSVSCQFHIYFWGVNASRLVTSL